MRTRRQDRVEFEVAQPTSPRQDKSPTVVSIKKVDGPTRTRVADPEEQRPPYPTLPAVFHFPLIVILSLSTSALGYSLTYPYTKAVLAAHARSLESWEEYGAMVGWRVFELGLGWFGNYDSYDLAALNLLSHGPPLYLLAAFYNTPTSALLITLAIETFSMYFPFQLLRPLSKAHSDPANAPNAELLTDKPIMLSTTLLSASIYTVTLYLAYATYLPTALIVHFDRLPSLEAAHEASYLHLLPVTVALGFAATMFIFTPSTAEPKERGRRFDPANATLGETFWWNIWGWSRRTKAVIQRTFLLMLVTGVNTALQTALTVAGAEVKGAIAWAAVWVIAAGLTGIAMGAVGGE